MSTIRKTIEEADRSKPLTEEGKEVLETLFALAEQQADVFMMEIIDSIKIGDDKKIPVTSLVSQTKEIRAMTKKSTQDIQNTVKECLDSFLNGEPNIVKGIEKLLSGALTVFLGESIGTMSKTEKYYVLTEGLSTVRFDVKCWYRSVQSASLIDRAEKVACIVGTKSVVDLSKIDLSTFIYLYQDQLRKSGIKGDDLQNEIKKVKEIYNDFQNNTNVNLTSKNNSAIHNFLMPGN